MGRPGFQSALGLVLAALAGACADRGPSGAPRAAGGDVGPLDLRHSLAGAGGLRILVPDAAALALVGARLAAAPPGALAPEVAVLDPRQPGRNAPRGADPLCWIGRPDSKGCEAERAALGVVATEHGFLFQGQEFTGAADGLIATVRDTARPGAVVSLVIANDLGHAASWLRDPTPTARLAWALLRAGRVVREGRIAADGTPEAGGALDLEPVLARLSRDARAGERTHFDWVASAAFDEARDEAWLAELDRAVGDARARLGDLPAVDVPGRLVVRFHETPEDLARASRESGFAVLRAVEHGPELALVHVPGWPDNAAFEVARAALLVAFGEPRAPWLLDAVAFESAGAWFGRPRAAWLAHLETGDLVPPVEQLSSAAATLSPHALAPLRGALLACCLEVEGAGFAANGWGGEAPPQLPSDAVFRDWLRRHCAPELEPARRLRAERRAASLERPTRRGACLVPAPRLGDPFAGGFGSRACEQSLARLRKLGATSVALCWCLALEPSEPRTFGDGPRRWNQAEDAALFGTILAAQSLDLGVVLMPQLVATEHGGWAGQVLLSTREERRALFADWQRELVHLGLLAELAGVDVLSLGSEAPDAAVTKAEFHKKRSAGELEHLRADWTDLIERCRGAFAGGLTYAARWDGEAQGIEFWGRLDFVGQNLFARADGPEEAAPDALDFARRLVAAFANLRQLAEAHQARPLVCGVGISSTARGFVEPSRPLGAVDLDVQARFYDGLARALQIGRRQQFAPAGLFVWCWSTDPDAGGPQDRGFTPQHKPAEAALARALQVR